MRYLEWQGYAVRYCQNVTDIDDDILRKAREVGEDWQKLGNRWTSYFIRDLAAINVRPPDYYPRARPTSSKGSSAPWKSCWPLGSPTSATAASTLTWIDSPSMAH